MLELTDALHELLFFGCFEDETRSQVRGHGAIGRVQNLMQFQRDNDIEFVELTLLLQLYSHTVAYDP